MYKITWVDDRPDQVVQDKSEVREISDQMGADGAILKWLTHAKDTGIINYYNKIVAYVNYQAPDLEEPEVRGLVLRAALQQYDRDDLVVILEEYDKFIQEDWLSGDNGPMDILSYIAIIHKA
jgi:hypothetical protein